MLGIAKIKKKASFFQKSPAFFCGGLHEEPKAIYA
jgi:hypothetical protein